MPAPPHKPGLSVIIGIGKPKGSPPGYGTPDGAPAAQNASQKQGGKVSPEDAACFDDGIRCEACGNFTGGAAGAPGQCSVVEGDAFGAGTSIVGCVKYFEPGGAAPEDEAAEGEEAPTTSQPGPGGL